MKAKEKPATFMTGFPAEFVSKTIIPI